MKRPCDINPRSFTQASYIPRVFVAVPTCTIASPTSKGKREVCMVSGGSGEESERRYVQGENTYISKENNRMQGWKPYRMQGRMF